MHIADGLDNFGLGRALQQITAGAGEQGIENFVTVLINGEHEDLDGRDLRFELSDTFDAAHFWQVDIHEQHVRGGLGNLGEGFFAISITTGADETFGVTDLAGEVFAYPIVVFYDGDLNCHKSVSMMAVSGNDSKAHEYVYWGSNPKLETRNLNEIR